MSKIFEYRNFRIIGVPGNYKLICNLSPQPVITNESSRSFVSFDVDTTELQALIIKSEDDKLENRYQLKCKAVRKYHSVYDLIDDLYEFSKKWKTLKTLISVSDQLVRQNPHIPGLIQFKLQKLSGKTFPAKYQKFVDLKTNKNVKMSKDGIAMTNIKSSKSVLSIKGKLDNLIASERKHGFKLNNHSTIDDSFKTLFDNAQNYSLYRGINGQVGVLISKDSDMSAFNLQNPKASGIFRTNCEPFNRSFGDYNISELSIIYPGNHEVHKFYDFKKDDIILAYIIDHYQFIRTKFVMAFEKASTTVKTEMPFIHLVLPFIVEKLGLTLYNGEQPRYAWSALGDKIVLAKFNELQKTKFDVKQRSISNFMMAQTLKYLGILNETQLNQISVHIAGTLFEMLVYMAERENKFELRDKLLNTLFELSRKVTKNS